VKGTASDFSRCKASPAQRHAKVAWGKPVALPGRGATMGRFKRARLFSGARQ